MSAKLQRNVVRSTYLFAHPGQTLCTELTDEILVKLTWRQLACLTPSGWDAAGRHIADSITSGSLHSLCLYDPDVLDLTPSDQYHIRQSLAFFSKRRDIDLGVDREDVASQKFWDAERLCQLTNKRFRDHSRGCFFSPRVEAVLHSALRKIDSVLGNAPAVNVLRPRFGPGASTQVPKKNACLAVKLAHVPACSTNLSDHLEEVLPLAPLGDHLASEESIDVPVHLAKLSFVPKSAKTDRAICTEPQLNGMFQLAIGDYIARRLRKCAGIDIRDQGPNQRAALYGSLSNASATLDLSSASDTLSLGLCRHLLSDDWFDLLCKFRSAEVYHDGQSHMLQKISSMGNGFTFPLETLIFWALASSCADIVTPGSRIRTLAYGDDLVVDVAAVPLVREVFDVCGFILNDEKSFWDGGFRESCGKDYVFGIDVRPIYVKDRLSFLDLITLYNGLRPKRGSKECLDDLLSFVDPSIRLFGPAGYGDGHFHVDDPSFLPYKEDRGYGGAVFETFSMSKRKLDAQIRRKFFDREGNWKCHMHARRVALYTVERRIRGDLDFLEPAAYDPDFSVVVPGTGSVRRTKIYIFEPPRP